MRKKLKAFFVKVLPTSLTLQRRFAIYLSLAIISFLSVLMILLSLFDVITPTKNQIDTYLSVELENRGVQLKEDIENLAAVSLSFADELEAVISGCMGANGLKFEELRNNKDALNLIQDNAFNTVYTNLRIAHASGAFYILDTTVNDSTEQEYFNGIYLKYSNIYSKNTANTTVDLFRGSVTVAEKYGLNLNSGWTNEMASPAFEDVYALFSGNARYFMSDITELPESWERARFFYSPIHGENGEIIGVCGFELSDLFFKLVHSTNDTDATHMICALLDNTREGYKGQFTTNQSGYTVPISDTIKVKEKGDFYSFECAGSQYIGKLKAMDLGQKSRHLAIIIPQTQYNKLMNIGRVRYTLIFSIIGLLTLAACFIITKRYVIPIRKILEQVHLDPQDYTPTHIPEIDDVLNTLATKDRANKKIVKKLETERDTTQSDLEQAQKDIDRLAYSRKDEIDPYDYEAFMEGLSTLTKTEKRIFDLFVEGKSSKEALEILGVKDSTLKFHVHNMLGKLGVSSRKEMLRYVTVMKKDN